MYINPKPFHIYIDMKGLRVEGQQPGAAQTETMAHPGECRHFGQATKLASKRHDTHEDRGFGGPIPVTVGTFETKVTTLTRISGVYHGGYHGAMGGGDYLTRHGTMCVCVRTYME